ncbi:hypothetical protein NC653_000743 [Populus alba x Populus x berolinensis]|uniref:Uncharacterized protein n=1 Tax=Populus alba x Populus x berolinensis TaxID=444605 RepID=A0AAD6RKF8_9ROSI|nr:hypothetical protein NC653_000743 [Populus alba x Populus x berolinensis]
MILERIKEIPELFIIGRPDVTIVAIRSNDLDIFEVNDIMISNMLASECIAETQQVGFFLSFFSQKNCVSVGHNICMVISRSHCPH